MLIAVGVLLVLGGGRARADSSERRRAVSLTSSEPLTSRVTLRERLSPVTRAPGRRHAPAIQARGRTSSLVRSGRPGDALTHRTRPAAAGSLRPVLGATAERVGLVLVPVRRLVDPVLEPLTQPLDEALGPVVRPVGDLLDPVVQPPVPAGTAPLGTMARPVVTSAGIDGPCAATGTVREGAVAAGAPSAKRSVPVPGPQETPASTQVTTRDAPTGSLTFATLALPLVLLWLVSAGRDGLRERARPPLLFPA
ncbi:MAG TPA: hypothetical protein VF486_01680 [Actinomycetes bacterium]